jgi:hypothetical protein
VRVFVVLPPISMERSASMVKFDPLPVKTVVAVVSEVASTPPAVVEIARAVAPVLEKRPVVSVLPFRSTVPAVSVVVRVEPIVMSPANCHVPPAPLKVTGWSIVLPLVVIVFVPDVAAKVVVVATDDKVIAAESVRSPKILTLRFDSVPEKPVKSTSLIALLAEKVTWSLPALTFRETAVVSVPPAELPQEIVRMLVLPL